MNQIIRKIHGIAGLLGLVCFFLLAGASAAWAGEDIKIIVNGNEVAADVAPLLKNDRTMVPIRFVTEPLGAALTWEPGANGTGGRASLLLDGRTVELTIGSKEGVVNRQVVSMDVAAEVIRGRTFVPLRFAGENLGAAVDWNGAEKKVIVTYRRSAADSNTVVPAAKKLMGFYYDSYSLEDITDDRAAFSDVIHFGYLLKADGTVREKDKFAADKFAAEGKATAEQKGMKTQMLVTAFDRGISDSVLGDEALRQNTVKSIVQFVRERDFDGVNLDYEVVSVSMRDHFTAFVRDLKQALPSGTVLSLSLRCRTYDSQVWLEGYDYGALAEYADQCIVMMYDQHYNGGEAGAVAGIDWMEASINYLGKWIPKEKFIVGLGAYGRYWPENGKGSAIFIQPAFDLAKEQGVTVLRDEATGVPHFDYVSAEKGKVSVWFEDAVSMQQKIDLVKKYNLAGVAVWRMGRVPADVWAAIGSILR